MHDSARRAGALDSAVSVAGSPNLILIDRLLAGLIEGAMVAVSIELIARSRHAERLGGFFLAMQALAQGLLALGLAWWVVPGMGANGGFLALGIVCLVSIGAALFVPAEYGEMPNQSASMDGVFTVRSILALLMIVLFFMFVVAVWTFLEPLGGKVGIDAQTVGVLVSIGLFVQVAASLAAAWLEAYLDYRLGILGCGVVGLLAAAILGASPTLQMFCVAVLAISFVWMFIVPFMIGMTLAADSTRNTCLLVPAAQLLARRSGHWLRRLSSRAKMRPRRAAVRDRHDRAQPRAVRSVPDRLAARRRVKPSTAAVGVSSGGHRLQLSRVTVVAPMKL